MFCKGCVAIFNQVKIHWIIRAVQIRFVGKKEGERREKKKRENKQNS
jgi:hypothetical protein